MTVSTVLVGYLLAGNAYTTEETIDRLYETVAEERASLRLVRERSMPITSSNRIRRYKLAKS